MWDLRARLIAASKASPLSSSLDKALLGLHLDYPLLLPSLVSRGWQYARSDSSIVPAAIAALFTIFDALNVRLHTKVQIEGCHPVMSTELIEREIRRFLSSEEPEVICISGRWGVGKTYAWNQYVKDAKNRDVIGLKRYSYVSLFGLNSLDEFKYAIFENTVQSSEIGVEPSLKTLQTNTLAAAEGLGRKFVWFVQQLPWVKTHVGGLGPVWFLSVKNTIVCVDDIERRGKSLSVRDVMGLVLNLKEHKECKVLLILNDEAFEEDKAEFERYYEKVVDTSLKFTPTPVECTRIALTGDTPADNTLRESCVTLGISNIRLIKKIERAVRRIEPLLKTYDEQVLKQAVQSLTLFGWSVYEPGGAPSVEYLKGRTLEALCAMSQDTAVPENEAAWNALLDVYGFTTTDEFDLTLLEGIRNGFFDSTLVEKHAADLDRRIKAAKQGNSFTEAWRLFHDSFADNQAEILDTIQESFVKNVQVISPIDLNGTVKLLKELGWPDGAAELIAFYITSHTEDRKLFDLDNYPFAANIDDPDVVRAFREKLASLRV